MEGIKEFIKRFVIKESREIIGSISREGIEVKKISSLGLEGHVLANEFPIGQCRKEFTPSTVIIQNGYGVWEIDIPKYVLKNLADMTLKIETVRTHGMLHTRIEDSSAKVYMNDQLVDEIILTQIYTQHKDFGIDSRRPYPILRFIDKNRSSQRIRIETDKEVYWDIDRISLEPVILRKEISPIAAMILGAVISAIIGRMF